MTATSIHDPDIAGDVDPDAGDPDRRRHRWRTLALLLLVIVLAVVSLPIGVYSIGLPDVFEILLAKATGTTHSLSAMEETVVVNVRIPRILGALLVGAGLAAAGAGYQTIFRNPLVSPAILGVSAGAGFGAALGILLGLPWLFVQVMAFAAGVSAALIALLIARMLGQGAVVVLVLAGIVVSTLFQAFISITQFLANPQDTLPAITFWLMGGLGRVNNDDLLIPAVIMAVCLGVLYLVRWPVTVMAAGEQEAEALGVDKKLVWGVVIGACTLMTATVVSLAGIVGWVGLVVPHMARFLVGPSFGRLLPTATLMGAGFLLIVDDVARSGATVELPLGVLTALVGAPFFVLLLTRARKQWL